ncbi:MAG: hypothetical protein M3460_19435 [Actinomycetota bacterium]|nr:hypothetical protein [Actinomycetota bacterium]
MIDLPDKEDRQPSAARSRSNRRAMPATCTTHGGARGYTNLVVRQCDSYIELDPHVDGSCVLHLDEASARVLFEALQEWLG